MSEIEQLSVLYNFLYELTVPLADFMENSLKVKYKEEWWKKGVFAKLDDYDKKAINKKNITSLKYFDIQTLLKLFKKNISIFEENIDINEMKTKNSLLDLSESILNIRNKVAHPVNNRLKIEIFNLYIGYLISFGKTIKLEDKYLIKLSNLNIKYFVKSNESNNEVDNESIDKIKIDKMFSLIKTMVLIPALKCKTLDEDIQSSILDTRDRLKIKKQSKEIYDFFKDALISKRGKIVCSELHKNGLKGFEDIVDEIEKIYNS